uniref:Uncharacterized protein n=1 Tax=Helicotheca tamesis TaxID=374047 RepID=A0A7S2I7H7_9STRA|mmetsp:Transcript_6500/g.8801  ORF Transcript_6500/g.8801 Transcript_6500/m.8801 type:complete len:358 (+) Transcript_6500:48-1121(+)|eukprot:CAMPEP_0185730700 /NCGR_PEP_ID=MMETSP1171-20130828/10722_1 /TAXON_ID=374046 /ORGANISM="Helicotheca tamensis, Strain CCMP826" /LENGTH=357 /DNA_ID=CAMNT_0028399811 /DNA_START=23 /DNA_END=1096 /DNA_ORIENTATION=-
MDNTTWKGCDAGVESTLNCLYSSFSSDGTNENSDQTQSDDIPKYTTTPMFRNTSSTTWDKGQEDQDEDIEQCTVVELARFNYESYYHLPRGSADLKDIENSSAGLFGWASCVLQNNEKASCKRERSGESNQSQASSQSKPMEVNERKKTCLSCAVQPRSDEEEARQLRSALLESLGVTVASAPSDSSEQSESIEKDEFEYDSDSSESSEEKDRDSENHEGIEQEKENTIHARGKCIALALDEDIEDDVDNQSAAYVDVSVSDDESKQASTSEAKEMPYNITPIGENKEAPSKDECTEHCEDSDGSKEEFVFVGVKPQISRSSWQWGTFVKSLKHSSSTKAIKNNQSSDDSSGEWSLV